jgi:hypothetical protein
MIIGSQKERNYENAKSNVGFDWDDAFVCSHSAGAAGFDRLRS